MNAAARPLRAVFFDVGDTLVRTRSVHAELLAEVAGEIGVALDKAMLAGLGDHIARSVHDRALEGRPFTFPAEESQRFWLETYLDFLTDILPAAEATRLARSYLQLLSSPSAYIRFDDALPTLWQLRRGGLRLGIVSNWEAWLPRLLRSTGLSGCFDHVIISGLCGVEKPDARIFTLALEEGGYHPQEVVHVGDSPAHDVEPALQTGINVFLLDRVGRHPISPRYRCISSLAQLRADSRANPFGPAGETLTSL